VLLGKDENPILADFGLAKLLAAASVKTMSGVTTGTPAYMAPEQVVGGAIGPAADRYALATIAFELVTGSVPFDGDSVLELLYAHVHREPPKASSRKPGLGPAVDAVLARGLMKDPEKRWESCAALVDALEAALEPAPAAVGADVAPAAWPAVAATMAIPGGRRGRRAPAMVVGAVAVIRNRTQTLTGGLSSATVQAGDTVVVNAQNLPPNQAGVVRILTPSRELGPFHADRQGEVQQGMRIPPDEPAGDHLVQLCWSGACHDLTTVHVTR
jgi:hypothetical protein